MDCFVRRRDSQRQFAWKQVSHNIHAETQVEAQLEKERIRTELERDALLAKIMPEPVASAETSKLSASLARGQPIPFETLLPRGRMDVDFRPY